MSAYSPRFDKIFPEMTDEELYQHANHMGSHLVSWYDEAFHKVISSRYSSVICFIEKNGLSMDDEPKIRAELYHQGKYVVHGEHGEVGIYL